MLALQVGESVTHGIQLAVKLGDVRVCHVTGNEPQSGVDVMHRKLALVCGVLTHLVAVQGGHFGVCHGDFLSGFERTEGAEQGEVSFTQEALAEGVLTVVGNDPGVEQGAWGRAPALQ